MTPTTPVFLKLRQLTASSPIQSEVQSIFFLKKSSMPVGPLPLASAEGVGVAHRA